MKTTGNSQTRIVMCAVALMCCVPFSKGAAQSTGDWYKGRTISLIIGAGAGGGIDLYGRLVARHMGKHLPGQPSVVPQNMPAAGSIAAANYLYNVAPKDGTVIGIMSQGIILNEVLRLRGLQFEVGKFNWVGRISSDVLVAFTWHANKVKTIADAMAFETTIGGTGAGTTATQSPQLLNQVVGTKFKVIVGYPDTGVTMLAMERGELDGTSTGWGGLKSSRGDWVREKINMLVQMGTVRHPDLPDVPSWVDVAKTPDDKKLLWMFGINAEIGKSILAPPGTAPERIAMLRSAFARMLRDPEFLTNVETAHMDFAPMLGAELQKIIIEAVSVPEALRERARSFKVTGN
jgi:tripartite-type tricarboxylate transporter receptor subunit TctC